MLKIIGLIALIVGLCFLYPLLSFIVGWIVGCIIKVTMGASIISGLAIVGINLPLEKIPLFFGTLAVIASFFHSPEINKKKE